MEWQWQYTLYILLGILGLIELGIIAASIRIHFKRRRYIMNQRTCKLCGCTEDNACITDEGPCSWVLNNICSACVIELTEDQHNQGPFSILILKDCRHCNNLTEQEFWYGVRYTCNKGRFWGKFFAKSGITRPNKSVAEAQFKCPSFEINKKWLKEVDV